jgi:hypothetical protein
MDEGRLVEKGGHEELLLLDGLYKKLHDMQFRDQDPKGESRPRWRRLLGKRGGADPGGAVESG